MNFLEEYNDLEKRKQCYQSLHRRMPGHVFILYNFYCKEQDKKYSAIMKISPNKKFSYVMKAIRKALDSITKEKMFHNWFFSIKKNDKKEAEVVQPAIQIQQLIPYQQEDGFIYIIVEQKSVFG